MKLGGAVGIVIAATTGVAIAAARLGAKGTRAALGVSAIATAVAYTAYRRMAEPLDRLLRDTERAARGEPFAPWVSGIEEIDCLSRSIGAIADQVARERDAMRRHARSAVAIATATDLADIADIALAGLVSATDSRAGALWVVPATGAPLDRVAATGLAPGRVPATGDDEVRAALAREARAHRVAAPAWWAQAGGYAPLGVLVVPLHAGKQAVGVAMLAATPPRRAGLGDEELTRAQSRAALALQHVLARDRSEALVRELEDRHTELEAVLGALDDPVVMHDANGRVHLANGAAERLVGASPVGLTMDEIAARLQLTRDDGATLAASERAAAALERGDRLLGALRRYVSPTTGVVRIVRLDAAPVLREGALVGGVVHAHDITEEHELRGELEAANRRLRAQNAELTAHEAELEEKSRTLSAREAVLQKQNEELERSSQLKSDFLASMSHELRTPLNAVIGFAELLRAGNFDPLTPHQTECVGNIVDAGQSLLGLINDILDLSKIEAGRMEVVPTRFDVADPVGQAEALVAHAARGKGVALESAVRAGDVHVFADRDRVRQVALNLLSNAVKFTPEGGRVVIDTILDGGFAVVRVTDTGIGIDPERATLLFQPFVQLDGGYARRFPGTGLGLSISKRLVEMMGGTIGFSSQPGAGSTFHFSLPLAERVTPAAGLPMASRAPDRRESEPPPTIVPAGLGRATSLTPPALAPSTRIIALVVDDDQMNRRVVESMLEPCACVIVQAASGLEALAIAAERRLDVVLLDIGMPDVSGLEVAAQLRADPVTAKVPIIAVSGHARPTDVERATRAGCTGFVAKPIARMKLYEAIDQAVGDTRWRRARR